MNPYLTTTYQAEDETDRRIWLESCSISYPLSFLEEFKWISNHNSHFLERCRIYIADNWNKVSDWSEWFIEIGNVKFGKKFYIGRNVVYAIPIKSVFVDIDWNDGDITVCVNGTYAVIDDADIIGLALYIEGKLQYLNGQE